MAGALLANATNALSINNKTSNLCLSNSLGLRNPGSFTCSSLRNLLGFSFEKEKGIIFKKFVTTASMAESVIPGVIIGAGRIGQALYNMSDKRDVIVTRGETIPQDCPGPIFVCTRNDALEGVVNATPVHRRKGPLTFCCARIINSEIILLLLLVLPFSRSCFPSKRND